MTKTAAETVAHFRSFNTHYYGPTTSAVRNEYNGKWYANPFTVLVGRAGPDDPGEYYCADAVTAMLMWAGIDIREDCKGFCNCGALFNYMWEQPASGQYGFKTVALDDAQAGDITLLHFNGVWGHVFMHRAPNSGGYMHNVEGDTSNAKWPGSSTVGGVQTDRDRLLSSWRGSTHTFRPTGYAPPPKTKPGELDVDGYLGQKTLDRWGAVMGTHTGKVDLIKAVQTFLNANGGLDERGHKLVVDGIGIYDNRAKRTAFSHTQAGLQRYLHSTNDGVLTGPPTGSAVVKILQRRLNAAKTGSKVF